MAHISMKDIYMNTYNVKCYFVVVYLHSCWCVVQCFSCKKLNSFITYTQRKKNKHVSLVAVHEKFGLEQLISVITA